MLVESRQLLLAVLSNPPTTDGKRTLARLETVRKILGYEVVSVANIFAQASYRTGEISRLGVDDAGWLTARESLGEGLAAADGVLLAYGVGAPVGAAREKFRAQVGWLERQLAARQLPVWQVGDAARHPSRWQRWTHRAYPDLAFPDALRRSLVALSLQGEESPKFGHSRGSSRLQVDPALAG